MESGLNQASEDSSSSSQLQPLDDQKSRSDSHMRNLLQDQENSYHEEEFSIKKRSMWLIFCTIWKVFWSMRLKPWFFISRAIGLLGVILIFSVRLKNVMSAPSSEDQKLQIYSSGYDPILDDDNNTFYWYPTFSKFPLLYPDYFHQDMNMSLFYIYPDHNETHKIINDLFQFTPRYIDYDLQYNITYFKKESEFKSALKRMSLMNSLAFHFSFDSSNKINGLQIYSNIFEINQLYDYIILQFSNYFLKEHGLNITVIPEVQYFEFPIIKPIFFSFLFISFSLFCINLYATEGMGMINQIISDKLILLLKISGAPETLLWVCYHSIDLILLIPFCILSGLSLKCNSLFKSYLSAPVAILASLLIGLSSWSFGLFFVHLFKTSKGPILIHAVILVFSVILAVVLTLNDCPSNEMPASSVRPLFLFLPQFSAMQFYKGISYTCTYLNKSFSFSNMDDHTYNVKNSTCLEFLFYSFLLYFGLYIILLCLMPRGGGLPPIGWSNLFSIVFWKQFFRKKVSIFGNIRAGQTALQIDNISKSYFGIPINHALNEVSFEVKVGEVIILIGPNGCGKSTLINSMIGAIPADSGSVKIFGAESSFKDMQNYIGVCFQDNIIFPKMTVENHLKLFGTIRGASPQEINDQIELFKEQLELQNCLKTFASNLSGGQKRKLCIALAFIGNPPIVILDEPTAGIDASARQSIWKAISHFHGTTSFISSHALEEAESVCTTLFTMSAGKLVFKGTPNNLREEYHCGYIFHPVRENIKMQELVEFMKIFIPETVIDEEKNDQILMPMSDNIGNMLHEIKL